MKTPGAKEELTSSPDALSKQYSSSSQSRPGYFAGPRAPEVIMQVAGLLFRITAAVRRCVPMAMLPYIDEKIALRSRWIGIGTASLLFAYAP